MMSTTRRLVSALVPSRRPQLCRPPWLTRLEDRVNPVNVANVKVSNGVDTFGHLGQDTQSETSVIAFPAKNGQVYVEAAFNDTGAYEKGTLGKNTRIGYARSTDGGASFTDLGTPPPDDIWFDPILARDAATGTPSMYPGRLYLVTISSPHASIKLFRSDDEGLTWQEPVKVGGLGGAGVLDKPWVAVDNAGIDDGTGYLLGQGNVYLAALDFQDPRPIVFTHSRNGGASFEGAQVLAQSVGLSKVQGANVTVGPDHSIYVCWIRSSEPGVKNTIEMRRGAYDPFNPTKVTFDPPFPAPARTVATLNTDNSSGNLDLGFRTNSLPQAVVNPLTGELYVVYNDPVVSNGAVTDRGNVYLTRSSNQGVTWSAPVKVNDDAGTNDQFCPTVAIADTKGDGVKLIVSFYDRRHDPVNMLIDYYAAVADITGPVGSSTVTFRPNQRITTESFPAVLGFEDPGTEGFTDYMGDYDVAAADAKYSYHTWGDNRDLSVGGKRHQANVRFAKVALTARGPEVVSVTPNVNQFPSAFEVRVTFNQAMDPASFKVADDLISFTRAGVDLTSKITDANVSWPTSRELRITFPQDYVTGKYVMTLGPNILSAAAPQRQVDDDLDGQEGETIPNPTDDRITVSFDYVVVNTADNDEAIDSDGKTSLREAIAKAHTIAGPVNILFDPAVFAVSKTITLQAQPEPIPDELVISRALTITGPAAALTIDALAQSRIFNIDAPGRHHPVWLTGSLLGSVPGLTLTNGNVAGNGGAILIKDDTLILTNCNLTKNTAGGVGGAVASIGMQLERLAAAVSVVRSTISGENKAKSGGGLYLGPATSLTMTDSTVADNNATSGNGGGLFVSNFDGPDFDARVTIRNSTISGNTAVQINKGTALGGGLFLEGVRLIEQGGILINCTVSGNTAGDPTDPEYFPGQGGGLFIDANWGKTIGTRPGRSIGIFNSTVTANTAVQVAGKFGGRNIAVAEFKPGGGGDTLTLDSTIVASDSSPGGQPDIVTVVGASANVLAKRSLIGNVTDGNFVLDADLGTNRIGTKTDPVPPQLDPLAFYGGPTKTHRLQTTSKAVNFGQNALALPYDQRGIGFVREVGKRPDIGAYEREESKGPGGGEAAMVTGITVNDGLGGAFAGGQRSRVMTVAVYFNREVWFDPAEPVESAFRLRRQTDGAEPGLVTSVGTALGGGTVVTLSFTGAVAVEDGSLADGGYTLTISCGMVDGGNFDGDGDGLPGGDYVLVGGPADGPRLFRLFGDYDGNGAVELGDFGVFRSLYGVENDPLFAFDGSGWAGNAEYAAFRARFGMSIAGTGGVIPVP